MVFFLQRKDDRHSWLLMVSAVFRNTLYFWQLRLLCFLRSITESMDSITDVLCCGVSYYPSYIYFLIPFWSLTYFQSLIKDNCLCILETYSVATNTLVDVKMLL